MAEAIREIKEIVKRIESELHNLKNRLTSLELSEEPPKRIRAAEDWLVMVKETRGKWSSESPSAAELSRLGRRHIRS